MKYIEIENPMAREKSLTQPAPEIAETDTITIKGLPLGIDPEVESMKLVERGQPGKKLLPSPLAQVLITLEIGNREMISDRKKDMA
jgi:hypothetical protein